MLFVVVAGLLGMHGLESHGSTHAITSAHGQSSAGGAMDSAVDRHADPAPAGVSAETSGSNGASLAMVKVAVMGLQPMLEPRDFPSDGGVLLGMCLAILVGSLLAMMGFRRRAMKGLWLARTVSRLGPAGTIRVREPPSLTMLCVRRC